MGKAQQEKRAPRAFFMESKNAELELSDYRTQLNGKSIEEMVKEAIPKHPDNDWFENIPVKVLIVIEEIMAEEETATGHKFEEPKEEEPEEKCEDCEDCDCKEEAGEEE